MVGEVHEEVDRRPEVEGVVGRGGALTPQQTEQHQHRTTHPPDSRRACRDSAARATHSHTPHTPTMWSSRMARRRRVVRHAFSPTSYRHRSSSESIAPSHSARVLRLTSLHHPHHLPSLLRSARLLRQRRAHLRRVPQTAHRARGWRQTVTGAQQTAVAVIFEEHSRGKRGCQHAGGVEAEKELMVLVDDRNRLDFGGEVKRELGGVI